MKISNEIRIGILGVVALVVFVLGYNFLKGTGIFSSKREILVKYENVQGLTPASYVQLNGMNVGLVNEISFNGDNTNEIIVAMSVDKKLRLPQDSRAVIVSDGLLGTKAVRLELGSAKEEVKNNEFIQGTLEVGMMDKLGSSVEPVIANVEKTIASLDTVMIAIKNIMNDQMQQNLKSTISNLNASMKDINELSSELAQQKGKISGMVTSLNSFSTNLNKNNASINNIVRNAEVTTGKISKIELEQTVKNLENTLKQVEGTLTKLNTGNGSMALLMNDDKLYKNVKNTMETINNLLYDISARPKRYINFSVFGKKEKDNSPPPLAPNSKN